MKKFLIFLLIAAIGIGLWIFIAHKNEEAFLQKLYEEATNVCMRASERMMEDKTIQVHSVDFNLKELRPVVEGMRYVAYVDWYVDDQPTAEEAYAKLLPRIHDGAIVLLHTTSATNAAILDDLLSRWEEMGYTFASLDALPKA